MKLCRTRLDITLPCLASLVAFVIVLAWFPDNLWTMPVWGDDAPAHYYFVQKILDTRFSQVFSLTAEGLFYPPLFHILAYLLAGRSAIFGVAFAWVVSSGLIFPIGVLFLVCHLVRNFDKNIRIALVTAAPILSVTFYVFPYLLLQAGPLLAYGFALTILPWSLLAALCLMDKLKLFFQKTINRRALRRQVILFVISIIALGLAQPRALFTFCLIIAPFVIGWLVALGRIYKKQVICGVTMSAGALVGAVTVFVATAWDQYGEKLLNPAAWFKLHPPTQSIFEGIISALTLNVFGHDWPAIFATIIVIAAIIFLIIKKHYAVVAAFLLTAFVYFATVSLSGAVANVVTAPWYRDENRIIAMLVVTFVPVTVLALAELFKVLSRPLGQKLAIISIVVILTTIIEVCGIAVGVRTEIRKNINEAAEISTDDKSRILTSEKVTAFNEMKNVVGARDVVVGDPFTGLQFLYVYTGRPTYFSVINPRTDKKPEYAAVEESFAAGEPEKIQQTVCGIAGYDRKFFADFGAPYKTDLDLFAQFHGLRDPNVIQNLVEYGVFESVAEYPSGQSRPFVLYRVKCQIGQ